MGHGTSDIVVKYSWHKDSVAFLKGLGGGPVVAKHYEGMQHEACEEEIADVVEFLQERLQRHSEKPEL